MILLEDHLLEIPDVWTRIRWDVIGGNFKPKDWINLWESDMYIMRANYTAIFFRMGVINDIPNRRF
jgi:hypothetical protein